MGRFNLRPWTGRAGDGLSGGSDLGGQSILKWGLAQLERHCLIKMQGLMVPMVGACMCARSWSLDKASNFRADCCRHLLPCLLLQLVWTMVEMTSLAVLWPSDRYPFIVMHFEYNYSPITFIVRMIQGQWIFHYFQLVIKHFSCLLPCCLGGYRFALQISEVE